MIFCSKCGKSTKYYDTVKRFVRVEHGKKRILYIENVSSMKK